MTTHHAKPKTRIDSQAQAQPIHLIAIDIDGTLLRTDKRLSHRCIKSIKQATEKGIKVVLASARPPRSMREIYKLLGLDTLQINYNGALIHDQKRNRHVYHRPLSPEVAARVVKLARKTDPKVIVSVEILDKWYTDHVDETLLTETSKAFAPDFVGPLEAFLHVPVTKLMLLAPPRRITRLREVLSQKFDGEVAVAISDTHLIQIVHPDVDKSRALMHVAHTYNVPQRHVMAIGDAPNDLGMVRWAGVGVAVENAWDAVRHEADVVVPSNDDDGVAFAIEKYALANGSAKHPDEPPKHKEEKNL